MGSTGKGIYCAILILITLDMAAGQEFRILFTGSANGTIENCLCPKLPLGGLEKRAQFVAEYREKFPDVLVLDAGDNFVDYLSPGVKEVILEAFKITNYDLINIGDQDVAHASQAYLDQEHLGSYPGEAVTLVKGGQKFSIMTIMHPGTVRFYPDSIFAGLDLSGYKQQIEDWLSEPSEGIFRILLSHSGLEHDKRIAKEYGAIDLIVGGHSQNVLLEAVEVNDVLIVQAGSDAGYVGELGFTVKRKKYKLRKYELHPMELELPGHPVILELIDRLGVGISH
jgi:2',3'-cyclic-nucleotide 2'-phosphodiesterase (5'-nucleotidase family)